MARGLSAGLNHIAIRGVTVTQTLVLPLDGPSHATGEPEFLFTSPIPDQFEFLRSHDDEAEMDRTFTVPAPGGSFLVGGQVTPLSAAPSLPSNDLSGPSPRMRIRTDDHTGRSGAPYKCRGHGWGRLGATGHVVDALFPQR